MGDEESDGDGGSTEDGDSAESSRYASVARVYFVALSEWGLVPDVLNDQWTPEALWLMFRERRKELRRQGERIRKLNAQADKPQNNEPVQIMNDIDLFKRIKGLNYVGPADRNKN